MQQDQHCCHSTTVTGQSYPWAPAAMPVRRHPARELTGTALVMFDVLRDADQAAIHNERIGVTVVVPVVVLVPMPLVDSRGAKYRYRRCNGRTRRRNPPPEPQPTVATERFRALMRVHEALLRMPCAAKMSQRPRMITLLPEIEYRFTTVAAQSRMHFLGGLKTW